MIELFRRAWENFVGFLGFLVFAAIYIWWKITGNGPSPRR